MHNSYMSVHYSSFSPINGWGDKQKDYIGKLKMLNFFHISYSNKNSKSPLISESLSTLKSQLLICVFFPWNVKQQKIALLENSLLLSEGGSCSFIAFVASFITASDESSTKMPLLSIFKVPKTIFMKDSKMNNEYLSATPFPGWNDFISKSNFCYDSGTARSVYLTWISFSNLCFCSLFFSFSNVLL